MENGGSGRLCEICGTVFDEDGCCGNGHKQAELDSADEKKSQLTGRCLVCNKPMPADQKFCMCCDD